MTKQFVVLAVNDARDFCECCGRTGLKRVVWILDTETGEERHFGTTCASKPSKGFDCGDEIKRAARDFSQRLKTAYVRAMRLYRAEGGTMTNGRDANGSPIATVDDRARYDQLVREALARAAPSHNIIWMVS